MCIDNQSFCDDLAAGIVSCRTDPKYCKDTIIQYDSDSDHKHEILNVSAENNFSSGIDNTSTNTVDGVRNNNIQSISCNNSTNNSGGEEIKYQRFKKLH